MTADSISLVEENENSIRVSDDIKKKDRKHDSYWILL